jgi:hypothetical protein
MLLLPMVSTWLVVRHDTADAGPLTVSSAAFVVPAILFGAIGRYYAPGDTRGAIGALGLGWFIVIPLAVALGAFLGSFVRRGWPDVAVAAILCLALATTLIWLWRPRPSPLDQGDALVLVQLEKAGSDLAKPHKAEFYLYLPTQWSAGEAAQRLRREGYDTRVEPSAGNDGKWLCLATRTLVLNRFELSRTRRHLTALAIGLNGEYDGWGAAVVQ